MKYNELSSTTGKSRRRVGRGIAAGQGKTAGRGTKGQGARTGFSKRPGFEGGQNPLMQRLPKLHGFRSARVKPENIYTGQLNELGAKIDNQLLAEKGLVSSPYVNVKLLNKGELTKKVSISVQAASENAIEAVQKAGGEYAQVPRIARPASKKKDDK